MQKRKGFTTVELVIVIAVIAILATALIPTFGGLIDSANHTADVQTAKNLTTLVMTYNIDHPIKSERDLADAINEGMKDPNYYANLKAKSAKKGYCFWYDYKNYTVEVGTVEEMANKVSMATPNFSDWDITLANGFAGSTTFVKGLRADLVEGYLLMGYEGGNDLMDLICDLESAADAGEYADALAAINTASTNTTGAIQAAVVKLNVIANTTVIHNENGAFAPSADATAVHIPQGTAKLSNDVVVADGGDLAISSATVAIPSGTTVSSGSLTYLSADCTINVNIPSDELPNTIELSATVATIAVNNGTQYTQSVERSGEEVKNVFTPVGGGTPIADSITGDALAAVLKSYLLKAVDNEYIWIDTENKVIYFSTDLRKAADKGFRLEADNFLDSNNNTGAAYGLFQWSTTNSKGETSPVDTNSKYISIDPTAVKSVKVSTLGIEYLYNVKEVKVESFAIESINDIKPSRNVSFDDKHYSWTLKTQITLTDDLHTREDFKIKLDKTITESVDANNRFTTTSDINGSLALSVSTTLTGDSSNKIQFSCSGTPSQELTITLIDTRASAFDINDDVDTRTKFNFNFVVGTTGYEITLGDLFTKKDGKIVSDAIILSKDGVKDWKEITLTDDLIKDDNWKNISLNSYLEALNSSTLYIKVYGGTYSYPLYIDVKVGAYNIADPDSWKTYITGKKTGTDIAIVRDITIDVPATDDPTAEAAKYTLNLGAGNMYGNFQTIKVTETFLLKRSNYNDNYLILVNGGSINNMIIDGPDYGDVISIDDDQSKTKGTFVTGVRALNATINDSFLSGFRSPLHVATVTTTVDGVKTMLTNTTVVTNTTLHKGNFANLFIDASVDIEFNNVTTVQYETTVNGASNIASGIFIKYRSPEVSTQLDVKLHGTITQHNMLSMTQLDQIAAKASAVSFKGYEVNLGLKMSKYTSYFDPFAHKVTDENGTELKDTYYDTGIFAVSLKYYADLWFMVIDLGDFCPDIDVSELEFSDGTTVEAATAAKKDLGAGNHGTAHFFGRKTCSTNCSHKLASADINTHIKNLKEAVKTANASNK